VAYRPFAGGLLVNKRADRNAIPEGDRWKRDGSQKRMAQRDQIFEAAGLKPDNLTAAAVKFCLTSPCIASLVTGINTREQIKEIIAAADGKYLDPTLGRKLYEVTGQLGVRRQCNR
jgi:aryl-alcohol dehydrogenase-like predicted oxidoreductase